MNCIQVTACQPPVNLGMHSINFRNKYLCGSISSMLCVTPIRITRFPMISLNVTSCISTYRQHTPVCLFGGKGKSENTNDDSSWKALEKAMGSVKKQPSIDESLKQQMAKQESYDDGDFDDGDIDNGDYDDGGRIGRNRPGDGDGGGRGGDGDSGLYGEPEDESSYFAGLLEEAMQVIFAFLALVLWYQYFIHSEDINRDIRDVIRYLLTKKKTEQLKRNLVKWRRGYQKLLVKWQRDYQKLLVKWRRSYQKLLVKWRRGYQKLQALPQKWLTTFIFNYGRKGSMLESANYVTSITTKPEQNLEREENIKQRNRARKKKDIKRAYAKLERHADAVYKKLRIKYELEYSQEEDTEQEQDTISEDEYTKQDMISKDEYTKQEQEQEQDTISKDESTEEEDTEQEQEQEQEQGQDTISKDAYTEEEDTDESTEEVDTKHEWEQDTISKDEYTEEEGGRIFMDNTKQERVALPTRTLEGIIEQEGGTYDEDTLRRIIEQGGGKLFDHEGGSISEEDEQKEDTISEEEEQKEDYSVFSPIFPHRRRR